MEGSFPPRSSRSQPSPEERGIHRAPQFSFLGCYRTRTGPLGITQARALTSPSAGPARVWLRPGPHSPLTRGHAARHGLRCLLTCRAGGPSVPTSLPCPVYRSGKAKRREGSPLWLQLQGRLLRNSSHCAVSLLSAPAVTVLSSVIALL